MNIWYLLCTLATKILENVSGQHFADSIPFVSQEDFDFLYGFWRILSLNNKSAQCTTSVLYFHDAHSECHFLITNQYFNEFPAISVGMFHVVSLHLIAYSYCEPALFLMLLLWYCTFLRHDVVIHLSICVSAVTLPRSLSVLHVATFSTLVAKIFCAVSCLELLEDVGKLTFLGLFPLQVF